MSSGGAARDTAARFDFERCLSERRLIMRMFRFISRAALGLALAAASTGAGDARAEAPAGAAATPPSAPGRSPSLPVEQYTLKNGLTVLLSPAKAYPSVAVELVYLVGSGHELPGRTGFAHLFEHLMFQGSGNYDEEYFTPYEPIGADVNGTTNYDRTNYYQEVPRQYVELPLWLESDRMRTLTDVLSQEKLDNQREVVKNERRQRYEIAPYGMDFWYLGEALYPEGHPYRHTPIGSHEDLSRAKLDDVRSFFEKYYVPKNAALVMVGDFDPALAKDLVEKYFGDIEPGERAPLPKAERPVITSPKHWIAGDEVELPRIYLAWHSPALFETDDAELDLLSSVLTAGKSSRLFKTLVYERKLAKEVSAYQISQRLGGIYVIEATAAPKVELDVLAKALDEELTRALESAPSADELDRAKNGYKKSFFQRMETYTERASLIGSYFLFTGRGDYVAADYQRYDQATPSRVLDAARRHLRPEHRVRLDFVPGKKGSLEKRELGTPTKVTP